MFILDTNNSLPLNMQLYHQIREYVLLGINGREWSCYPNSVFEVTR